MSLVVSENAVRDRDVLHRAVPSIVLVNLLDLSVASTICTATAGIKVAVFVDTGVVMAMTGRGLIGTICKASLNSSCAIGI
jgi:hypothetical protein